MKMSEKIDLLSTALCKAQSEITGAIKDSTNPHFNSKFATLEAVWTAVQGPLNNNGLSVSQGTEETDKGTMFHSLLMHTSGQYLLSEIKLVPDKMGGPQGIVSFISYMRRTLLAAATGCPQVDDDGNAASHKEHVSVSVPTQQSFKPSESPYPHQGNTTMSGGRHKDKTFDEIIKHHPDYLDWCMKQPNVKGQLGDLVKYAKSKGFVETHENAVN